MHGGAGPRTSRNDHIFGGAVLLLALLAGCGASSTQRDRAPGARAPAASLSPVRYDLVVDEDLARMRQTVCSEGPWTRQLVPIHAEGRARLVRAERVARDGTTSRIVPIEGGDPPFALPTARLAPDDCVRLELELAASGGGMNGCMAGDGFIVCATSAFVFAAEPWRPTARHRVTVSLAEGHTMSPVFAHDEVGLYLDERSFRYVGYAAFGDLETLAVPVPGGCARLTVPSRSPLRESPHLVPWIARAGLASAQITGLATARDASITAVALAARGPVLFGMAGRGVVPSVLLFATESPGPEIVDDWTLVHELSHLAVPYVPAADAWLSEGLATYYQEVLRARAGMQSAEAAWRAIDDGLRRGAADGTGRSLREESRRMHASRSYTRVYWAGAAIALLIDVALRTRGLGSLDDRIARVSALRDRTLAADALVEALDGGDGVVREVVGRWLDDERFPDVTPAYAALGLVRGPAGLALGGDGALRAAVMNPRGDVASNGTCPTIPGPRTGHIE